MLRKLVTAVAVFAIAATMPAESRTLDEIISDGSIRIGVNPNFPPMSSYGMTNQLEGFDIQLCSLKRWTKLDFKGP